jgi:hypothetical protein
MIGIDWYDLIMRMFGSERPNSDKPKTGIEKAEGDLDRIVLDPFVDEEDDDDPLDPPTEDQEEPIQEDED